MSNLLAPVARQRIQTDLGVVAPGALLSTYVSGTVTPLPTTSDGAGLVPNTNPLVASAGGLFGPIYLTPSTAYKFVLTDAAGVPIWTQDPVSAGSTDALTVAGGGTGVAGFSPPYGLIAAGTTVTSPLQVVGIAAAGYTLVSAGAALPKWTGNGGPAVVAQSTTTPGQIVTFDAATGNVCYIFANFDCTLAAPANPTDGQKLVIRFTAGGAGRTLTLTPGASGFRFCSAIPTLTQTAANTTDYIGCVYFAGVQCWDVVAYTKGF